MKKGIFLTMIILSILLTFLIIPSFLAASENIIYISETEIADIMAKSKTLISKFTPDGTELKKIYINGTMARVSPDGKKIVYLEHKGYVDPISDTEPIWEVALADENGKRIKNLPTFLNKDDKEIIDTVKLAWSPDGKKVVFLQYLRIDYTAKKGCQIMLKVLNLATNELRNIHKVEVEKESYRDCAKKTALYSMEWFSDNQRILMGGTNGIEIVDTTTKTSQKINKNFVVNAQLTSDGKKIIYMSGITDKEYYVLNNPSIWHYDIKSQKTEKLFSVTDMAVFLLMKPALSHDNRFLAFQIPQPPKKRSFHIVDLLNKKVAEVYADAEKLFLIPKEFSARENNLIICIGIEKDEDEFKYSYGIFNIKSKEYHKFKEFILKHRDVEPIYPLARAIGTEVDWRKTSLINGGKQ